MPRVAKALALAAKLQLTSVLKSARCLPPELISSHTPASTLALNLH